MLFELGIARKYLIPKRRQLTMSLIALMSVGVITLVVWLVLTFLSVTDGIEKGWQKKLTSMNAPVRVIPTPAYYNSYYYQVDSIANASNFQTKSIGEKLVSKADPYDPEVDVEIPSFWSQGDRGKDLVKLAYEAIGEKAQEYEISGALLKLKLLRTDEFGGQEQGSLTQATYLTTLASGQSNLLLQPRIEDLNHVAKMAEYDLDVSSDQESAAHTSNRFCERINQLLCNVDISKWRLLDSTLPHSLFPHEFELRAYGVMREGRLVSLLLSEDGNGKFVRRGDSWKFITLDAEYKAYSVPILCQEGLEFAGEVGEIQSRSSLRDLRVLVEGKVQGVPLKGELPWSKLEILKAKVITSDTPAPWVSDMKLPEGGAILPKGFYENGVKIGDRGYFSYGASTPSSVQEQRLPFVVAGFYDPGVMAIGPKSIITSPNVVRDINTSSHSFDTAMGNGIGVWIENLDDARRVKEEITEKLKAQGIAHYFDVQSFDEYDFARDLMQQFRSDKNLFTLVGGIILLVACTNIISLLVILVNDKKKEIGILQSMGASQKSIAITFAMCGGAIGLVSTLIGIGAAYLTLHNIDVVVKLLSALQGHEAFNAMFYGDSLPNVMSSSALLFIAIATPIISIIAGLIPAIKACKVKPAHILRAE